MSFEFASAIELHHDNLNVLLALQLLCLSLLFFVPFLHILQLVVAVTLRTILVQCTV